MYLVNNGIDGMFYFGIPLRAQESSRDWNTVCERFNATIHSILRQTSPEFTVLVACHQIPDLGIPYDSRIRFLQADFDAPSLQAYDAHMVDKGRKIHLILSTIKRLGLGYFMAVDADDLVSGRIVEFVQQRQEVPGWLIRFGFEYQVGRDFVQLNPVINRHCGTTNIVQLRGDDLPDDMTDMDATDVSKRYVMRRWHRTWPVGFAELGRRFRTLPFPGCIYVTGYSDNYSRNAFGGVRRDRFTLRRAILMASPRIALKKEIRNEFGL
jgi:hypothetical protein